MHSANNQEEQLNYYDMIIDNTPNQLHCLIDLYGQYKLLDTNGVQSNIMGLI